MKQLLHVDVGDYDIEISDNSFDELKLSIDDFTSGRKRLFVISKKVYNLYKKHFNFNKEELLILPDGEKEKNCKNYIKIIKTALNKGLTRHDVMIAFGGGVIGDLTGFAASTYMRGIDYIQIPTTLLSMVDSSVGGKTAIDISEGKNIAGTFYQPKAVFININFLKTLERQQFNSGLGEILKYAFIETSCGYSKPVFFFEFLTLCCEKFFEFDTVTLIRIIDYSLKLKITVVNKDEKENGLRKILNLGHTLAHALETITKYKKFTHGEAVVYGMFLAFNIAFRKGLINYSYYRLSVELMESLGFKNLNLGKVAEPGKIIRYMKRDKKATQEGITFILPCGKKQVKEVKYSEDEILEFLK
ncbi:MAG: 3-dehydroquinate synthase [bacterium]|nr:3-dehydroquinate synthase [bacterium]